MDLRLTSLVLLHVYINCENNCIRTGSSESIRCSNNLVLLSCVEPMFKYVFQYFWQVKAKWNSFYTSSESHNLQMGFSLAIFLYLPYSISSLWLLIRYLENVLLIDGFLMMDKYGSMWYLFLNLHRKFSFEEFNILCFQNSAYFSLI